MRVRVLTATIAAASVAAAAGDLWAVGKSFEGKEPPEIELASVLNAEKAPKLADLKGKVAVVEFWATWCPPCRTTIPHLNKLHAKFKDKDVVILGISKEPESKVKPFVQKLKMTYVVGMDKDGRTSKAYGIRSIPTAYVLDKGGVVRWEGHPATLTDKVIEDLLKAKPVTSAKGG